MDPSTPSAPSPLVAVLPQPRVPSWPKRGDLAPQLPTGRLLEVLTRTWSHDDAHVLPYTHVGRDSWPRYSVGLTTLPEADEVYLTSCFVDLDLPEHLGWPDETLAELAVAGLRKLFPEAGAYATRGGARLVWVLARPVPIVQARWWLRAWVLGQVVPTFGTAVARHEDTPQGRLFGLAVDKSSPEWTRCFRLPRTLRDGVVQDWPIDLSALEAGARLDWWPEGYPDEERREGAPSTMTPAPDEVPEVPEGWDAWVSGRSKAGPLVPLLREGRPFGPPEVPAGARNTTLKVVVNSLAQQLWRGSYGRPTAGELYGVLHASVLAEHTRDPGAPDLGTLWRFCEASAARQLETRQAPRDPDTCPPAVVVGPSHLAVYDPDAGTFVGPVAGAQLYTTLKAHQPQLDLWRPSGASVVPVPQLALARALPAGRLVHAYPGVNAPPWDSHTQTAVARTFRASRVAPEHDPEVQGWLDLLLPREDRDRVLDWLATAGQLNRPTSALYLQGDPGLGKGMLAAALAGIWGAVPASFAKVVGRFNDDLLRSPVVFLDEGMATDRDASARFRSLVAESSHPVETKGQPVTTLLGCPRVIVAANDGNAIQLTGAHGTEALEAIAARILHVRVRAEARRYLDALGGAPYTQATGWVRAPEGGPGRVTRHLAWLAASRQVRPGARFLVEGRRTDYHVGLVLSDPLYHQTLVAVAAALAPDTPSTEAGGPGVWCGGVDEDAPGGAGAQGTFGDVWVNPRTLHRRWKGLALEDLPRPTVDRVAAALRALSPDSAPRPWRYGGTLATYWRIPGQLVLHVAADLGYPDMGRIRVALANGTPGAPEAPAGAVVSLGVG